MTEPKTYTLDAPGAVLSYDIRANDASTEPVLLIIGLAHEPPASQELPDREPILAACADIRETYQRSGFGPAMAKFIMLVSYSGPLPADYAEEPAPDPAMFGLPVQDDGSRNDPLVGGAKLIDEAWATPANAWTDPRSGC